MKTTVSCRSRGATSRHSPLLLVLVGTVLWMALGCLPVSAAEDISALYSQGVSLANEGKYADAISVLKTALALAPPSLPRNDRILRRIRGELGRCYMDTKQYDAGIADALQWIKDCPEDEMTLKLGLSTFYKAKGDYANAIATLNYIVANRAGRPGEGRPALESLVECYRATDKLDEALAACKLLVAEYPEDNGNNRLQLGLLYKAKLDYDKAFPIFQELAAAGGAQERDASLFIEDCLTENGKHEEAVAYLTTLYVDHPEWRDEILFRRAQRRFERLWKYQDAIADLDEFMDSYPVHDRTDMAELLIAQYTLFGLHEVATARTLINAFIADHPQSRELIVAHHLLANCSYVEADYARAAQLFEQACQDPDAGNYRAVSLYMEADCCKRVGDLGKAKELLDNLIATYPEDCWAKLAVQRYKLLTGNAQ